MSVANNSASYGAFTILKLTSTTYVLFIVNLKQLLVRHLFFDSSYDLGNGQKLIDFDNLEQTIRDVGRLAIFSFDVPNNPDTNEQPGIKDIMLQILNDPASFKYQTAALLSKVNHEDNPQIQDILERLHNQIKQKQQAIMRNNNLSELLTNNDRDIEIINDPQRFIIQDCILTNANEIMQRDDFDFEECCEIFEKLLENVRLSLKDTSVIKSYLQFTPKMVAATEELLRPESPIFHVSYQV